MNEFLVEGKIYERRIDRSLWVYTGILSYTDGLKEHEFECCYTGELIYYKVGLKMTAFFTRLEGGL